MDLVNVSLSYVHITLSSSITVTHVGIPDEPPPPPPPVVTPTTGIDNSLNYTTSAFILETVKTSLIAIMAKTLTMIMTLYTYTVHSR